MRSSWIFGYASLIWKPGFEFRQSQWCELKGWSLRFWQASTDHRGVPEFPGRVATLVAQPGATVWGRAYIPRDPDETLPYLDHREQDGYLRRELLVRTEEGRELRVLCYLGDQELPSFVGPEDIETTSRIISQARGPSGPNSEYLFRLCETLESRNCLPSYLSDLREAVVLQLRR